MPQLGYDVRNHAFKKMLESRLRYALNTRVCLMISVCISTDNRLMSNTTVSKEVWCTPLTSPHSQLRLAVDGFDLTPKQLKEIVIGGFKRSFFPVSSLCRAERLLRCMICNQHAPHAPHSTCSTLHMRSLTFSAAEVCS